MTNDVTPPLVPWTAADVKRSLDGGAHTFPGGYPILYLVRDAYREEGIMHPKCVREVLREAALDDDDSASGWVVLGSFVLWEDTSSVCAHCEGELESAYGPSPVEDVEGAEETSSKEDKR